MPSPASDDADDAASAEQASPVSVGRRGLRGRRRSSGRSLDAPSSPKTRKRKASTIPDGEWLPGTWPAGHGGGSSHAVASGLGVGVGVMETEQLIAEIERRPGIYDSGCPQYQDRVAKWTLWCEVCEIMTPRWHHLDEDRKAARVKELQKRWKSLRDSFMKELKLQREMQRTGQTANRKKYVFFDQMTFLMPCLEARGCVEDRGVRSSGGLILREIDPYESETDSSKAERDGLEPADAADCHSDDAPVNLSTANGSGLATIHALGGLGGLGSLAGIGGLSGIGGIGGLSSLAGHSVLGSATAVTAVTGGSGSGGSQPDEERTPLMLTTSTTTTNNTATSGTAGAALGKYRPPSGTTIPAGLTITSSSSEWKRRRSTTPLNTPPFDDDEDDPDGDRLFLLSLAPSLRTLRGAAKSALKIELAQLVHKTLYEPDDALADSMTESLAPVVSLAEGSPASSTQSECGGCGSSTAKCTCVCRPGRTTSTSNSNTAVLINTSSNNSIPLPLPLALPLSLPRGLPTIPSLPSPKRARHIGIDFSNFNGHAASKLHGV